MELNDTCSCLKTSSPTSFSTETGLFDNPPTLHSLLFIHLSTAQPETLGSRWVQKKKKKGAQSHPGLEEEAGKTPHKSHSNQWQGLLVDTVNRGEIQQWWSSWRSGKIPSCRDYFTKLYSKSPQQPKLFCSQCHSKRKEAVKENTGISDEHISHSHIPCCTEISATNLPGTKRQGQGASPLLSICGVWASAWQPPVTGIQVGRLCLACQLHLLLTFELFRPSDLSIKWSFCFRVSHSLSCLQPKKGRVPPGAHTNILNSPRRQSVSVGFLSKCHMRKGQVLDSPDDYSGPHRVQQWRNTSLTIHLPHPHIQTPRPSWKWEYQPCSGRSLSTNLPKRY